MAINPAPHVVGEHSSKTVLNANWAQVAAMQASAGISAATYEAAPNLSTDQTAFLQAAITAAKAAILSPQFGSLDTAVRIYVRPGFYNVSSLNFTGCAYVGLWSDGPVILYATQQVTTGKPVIDLTGTSNCYFENIIVAGQTSAGADPSIIPNVGWLVAETTAGGDSNKNRFVDCGTLGKFGVAALYVLGSTDNGWYNCSYNNGKDDAVVRFVGTANPFSVSSPFVTIATSPADCGDNSFFQCEFHGHNTSAASAPTSRFQGVNNLRNYGGNHDNSGPQHVLFSGANKQILFSGTKFYSESGHAADDVFYANGASALRLVIDCCHTEDNAFSGFLINGASSPDYTGGIITGALASKITGPYAYFFADPFFPFEVETAVASAATTDLGAVNSRRVSITGTVTITSFGSTAPAGTVRRGRFASALTLTHNATSLILPGAANITTAANDRFEALALGSGNWLVASFTPATGRALAGGSPASTTANTLARYTDTAGTLGATTVTEDGAGGLSAVASINGGQLAGFRNTIINGAFQVAERGTSFTDTGAKNNDDTYNLDRWILLSDGNDVVDVSQETSDIPTNGLNAAKLLVVTVNKKFGLLQLIEQKNCIGLIGNTVTASASLKVNNTTRLDKTKMAIMSWSGTADAMSSDVISAWGADGVNPTLVSNWTYENTPADLNVTTSFARYSVSAAVDTASAKNIGLLIWSDNVTDTDANDTLLMADVQLELGSTATPFERRPFATELENCQRYFEVISAASDANTAFGVGQCASTSRALLTLPWKAMKRIKPTLTVSATSDWAFYNASIGAFIPWSSFNTATVQWGGHFDVTTTTAGLGGAGSAALCAPNSGTGAARMFIDAEL